MKKSYLILSIFILAVVSLLSFGGCSFFKKFNDKNNGNNNNNNNTKVSYSLSFNTDGVGDYETIKVNKTTIIYEKDIDSPVDEKRVFKGWYLDSGYTNKVLFPYTLNSNVVFYAKWEDKVVLNLKIDDKTNYEYLYESYTEIKENSLELPYKENKIFNGWYLDAYFTEKVQFPFIINKNTTFFAKFTDMVISNVTISFVTNTDEILNPIIINKGYSISESSIKKLTSVSKTFVGWYIDSNFTKKVQFPYTANSNVTFYAKWENKVKLTLNLTTGNTKFNYYTKNFTLNEEDIEIPYNEGKIFAGWYLDLEYTNKVVYPYVLSNNIAFYAKWEDSNVDTTVKVSFETNIDEKINSIILTKGSILNEGNIKKLSVEDKQFIGWYTDSNFTNLVEFPLTVNENTVLYAKWENKVKLILKKNEVDEGTSIYFNKNSTIYKDDLEIPSQEDKLFVGWYLDLNYTNIVVYPYTLTQDTTFYAKWEDIIVYINVTFVTNVDETIAPINLIKGAVLNEGNIKLLTNKYKTFLNWYLDANFTKIVEFPYTVNQNVTFYAKWQNNIVLDYNTKCDIELESEIFTTKKTLNEGEIKKPKDSVEREFLGWYLDSNLTSKVTYPYTITENTTFYAKWKTYEVYTLKYNIDDTLYSYKYRKGSEVKFEDLVTEYNGFAKKFKAFYYESTISNKVTFPFNINSDLTLYIDWEEFYVINFETNGGSYVERQVGTVYLKDIPTSEKFGYKLVGLSTDKEGKNIISYPYKVAESGVTLYYVWEKLPDTKYKVSFGWTVPEGYEDLYLSVLTEDSLPTPYKEGYKFIAWTFDDSNFTPIEFPYQLTSDIVLQAKFERDIIRDEDALNRIKNIFEGITIDFLNTLYGNYGIGITGRFEYKNWSYNPKIYNLTPEETTDEYIIENILTNGTCFDALRYNILDYSSIDALKNNTNSFRYKVAIDLDKWWNFEFPYEMEDFAKDYLISFYDNNWERMQYELLCYMLDKKDQLNDFSSDKLEGLYNEYLQVFTYYGFSTTDAVKIRELLMSIAPETYDDSILNYTTVVDSFLDKYILSEDAMYKEKSAL